MTETPELHQTAGWMTEAARRADGTLGLLTRTGSRAYGTDHAESDHDFRGVYIASMQRFCSLGGVQDSLVENEPHDTTIYELNHFARLAAKGNPTALEVLWGDEFVGDYHGRLLRDHRDLFLSKRVVRTYGGYAMSQIRKAKDGTGGSRGADHYKREKFKMHTLRLLIAGIHILNHGEVLVRLDEETVADVRSFGKLDIDEAERVAKTFFKVLDKAAASSRLPEDPDEGAINHLLYKLRVTAPNPA